VHLPHCVSPQPRRPPCTFMRVWTYSRGRHSFLSISLLSICDPYHEARSPDDVTPNCHRSALRWVFTVLEAKLNIQLDISWPPIAGHSDRGRINICHSLFNRSTIAYCTKIIICLICFSLFFVCGCAARRIIFSVSLWGEGGGALDRGKSTFTNFLLIYYSYIILSKFTN
jgi:hypothetical protein